MDDPQLEALEERSEDSWPIPCVEVCPGEADGALSVAPEERQGPGMQVERARALLSTGKLFWWIGGGLSSGVPRTRHGCMHALMRGVGMTLEVPSGGGIRSLSFFLLGCGSITAGLGGAFYDLGVRSLHSVIVSGPFFLLLCLLTSVL